MKLEKINSQETTQRQIRAETKKDLLSPNTETIPTNEQEKIKEHAQIISDFLPDYLNFLPKVITNEIEKTIQKSDGNESIKMNALGRYYNDGSPFSEGENGEKIIKNPTLKQLEKILFTLGMVCMDGEIVKSNWITDRVCIKNSDESGIINNGDFNNTPQITNITKMPLMLGCNAKMSISQKPITSFKSNQIVQLPDIQTPFDRTKMYYHPHTCHIKEYKVNGITCIFVTLGDYGEKRDDQKPISRENIYENTFTLAYVIEEVEVIVSDNKKQIPAFNNRVQEITLFRVHDNTGNATESAKQLEYDFRLLPNLKSIKEDDPNYKIKIDGDCMSVIINPDARENYFKSLVDRKEELEKLLDVPLEILKYKGAIDYELEELKELENILKNGGISQESFKKIQEETLETIKAYNIEIRQLLDPNNSSQIEKKNKGEIELANITLELQRLTSNKVEQIKHAPLGVQALKEYRKKIELEIKKPVDLKSELIKPVLLTAIGGFAGLIGGSVVTELTQPKTGIEYNKILEQKSVDSGLLIGSVSGLGTLLGTSSPFIKRKLRENKEIEDELNRVSGLKTPKLD